MKARTAQAQANRQLLWLDDEHESIKRRYGELLSKQGFDCHFEDPCILCSGAGEQLEALRLRIAAGALTVLVLDWQDGEAVEIYVALRDVLLQTGTRAILKSVYGPVLLEAQGVYQRFPELASMTFWDVGDETELGVLLPSPLTAQRIEAAMPPDLSPLVLHQLPLRLLRVYAGAEQNSLPEEVWRSAAWSESESTDSPTVANCPSIGDGPDIEVVSNASTGGKVLRFLWAQAGGSTGRLVWQMQQPTPPWFLNAEPAPEDPKQCLEKILILARQAGLARGRYYKITRVDGLSRPLLELTHCVPSASQALPVAVEMDDTEVEHFDAYASKFEKQSADRLVSEIRRMQDFKTSENDDAIWDQVIPRTEHPIEECWLVPVYYQGEMGREESSLHRVLGVFIFDLGKPGQIPERTRNVLAKAFLHALKEFRHAKRQESLKRRASRAENLLKLQAEMAQASGGEASEAMLTNAVMDIVLRASQQADGHRTVRSAAFARYDASRHGLVVGADTTGLMKDFEFGLGNEFLPFVMVRAARAGLAQLKNTSKGGDKADFPPIEFVPAMEKLIEDWPTLCINPSNWRAVRGITPDRVQQCEIWLKEVHSVVAIPIMDREKLLGVLTLRSSARYEFTHSVVEDLRAVAAMARPVLARMRAERSQTDFSSLVVHELRSILTRVRRSTEDASSSPGLQRLLEHGYAYSSLLLRHGGKNEDKGGDSSTELWQRLSLYGEDLKSIRLEAIEWEMHRDPRLVLKYSKLLEQVLLVLLDNAFRYARPAYGMHRVLLDVQPESPVSEARATMARIRLINPGSFDARDIDQVMFGAVGRKSHVGLVLARTFCQQEGGQMQIDSRDGWVTVALTWPLALE